MNNNSARSTWLTSLPLIFSFLSVTFAQAETFPFESEQAATDSTFQMDWSIESLSHTVQGRINS